MAEKEIVIKVRMFEGEKEICYIETDELEDYEIEEMISELTAELEKRVKKRKGKVKLL